MKRLSTLLLLGACVTETGGERIHFEAVIEPVHQGSEGQLSWTDDAGWDVTLTEASVALGPVYLWSDEPLLEVGWLLDAVVPRAFAQDHFEAGFVTAELTEQVRVDLVSGAPVAMPHASAIAGPSRSGEIWLEPASDGPTILLRGEATDGSITVPFALDLTYDDDWFDVGAGDNPVLLRRVRGIPWTAELHEGGRLAIGVDVVTWLDGIDWAELDTQPDDDGVHAITPYTQAGNVVKERTRSIGARRSWSLSWSE